MKKPKHPPQLLSIFNNPQLFPMSVAKFTNNEQKGLIA